MKVLLIYPPVANPTEPYLSVPALSAFLKANGVDVTGVDLNVLAFDRLLSEDYVTEAGRFCEERYRELDQRESLSLPEAVEYARIAPFVPRWKYLAELIDLAKARVRGQGEKAGGAWGDFTAFDELVRQSFELVFMPFYESERVRAEYLDLPQYACRPAGTVFSSDRLVEWTLSRESRFETVYRELLAPYLAQHFDVVGISVSFCDQLPQALKIASFFRGSLPRPFLAIGGAYPSRVMAGLSHPRVFDIIDAVILNDGEAPLLQLVRSLEKEGTAECVSNAIWRDGAGRVRRNPLQPAIPLGKLPPPDPSVVPLDRYLVDPRNVEWPFMLSHGCYWRKCAFCNNQLSLVTDFHVQSVREHILPKIRHLIETTGIRRFNFVDEAMPPAVLFELSRAILDEGVEIVWHGNVRAEEYFTPAVCCLMSRAGCREVQIGVESFNDDILKSMKKGTTADRLVRVISNFHDAGIAVHAYMIHGWPTETRKHTARTLKVLKRLMIKRQISSAFWHALMPNPSAPMFRNPSDYGIRNYTLDPHADIFAKPSGYEIAEGLEDHRDDGSLERIERFTSRLEARVKAEVRAALDKAAPREVFSRSETLDGILVFPETVVTCGGHYSLSEIEEKTDLPGAVFERKPQFRIVNVLTGASQEISEDVHSIVERLRFAAQRGAPLRSVVAALEQVWGLESGEIEDAVLSVLSSLSEVGVRPSGKKVR